MRADSVPAAKPRHTPSMRHRAVASRQRSVSIAQLDVLILGKGPSIRHAHCVPYSENVMGAFGTAATGWLRGIFERSLRIPCAPSEPSDVLLPIQPGT